MIRNRSRDAGATLGVAVWLACSSAVAEPSASPPSSPSSNPPPQSPKPGPLPYTHDGFFARLSVGPGLFRAWTDSSSDVRHFSGGTISMEAALGGTLGHGFVLGGSVLANPVFALSSHDDVVDGSEPDLHGVRFNLNAVGVFADCYPNPKGGLDIHAFVGYGWLSVTRPGSPNVDEPSGPLLSGGIGYDWFVAEQLSIGVHARVSVGLLDVNETFTSVGVTTFVPALLVAGTYH